MESRKLAVGFKADFSSSLGGEIFTGEFQGTQADQLLWGWADNSCCISNSRKDPFILEQLKTSACKISDYLSMSHYPVIRRMNGEWGLSTSEAAESSGIWMRERKHVKSVCLLWGVETPGVGGQDMVIVTDFFSPANGPGFTERGAPLPHYQPCGLGGIELSSNCKVEWNWLKAPWSPRAFQNRHTMQSKLTRHEEILGRLGDNISFSSKDRHKRLWLQGLERPDRIGGHFIAEIGGPRAARNLPCWG